MIKILYDISYKTNNNIIFVGGYARVLEHDIEYNKKEIDFCILSVDNIVENLNLKKIRNDFCYPILERYTGFYLDFFLDVFLTDRVPIYKIKNGLKYATIEDDIEYFNLLYKNSNNNYYLNKLNENIKRCSESI